MIAKLVEAVGGADDGDRLGGEKGVNFIAYFQRTLTPPSIFTTIDRKGEYFLLPFSCCIFKSRL